MYIINRVSESEEPGVAFTDEENINNKTLIRYEDIKSEIYESDPEDYDGSDTNNGNESDSSKMEFVKEEIDLKYEIETTFDMEIPVVNSNEGNVNSGNEFKKEEFHIRQEKNSEHEELETIRNEFGDVQSVACQIGNVYTTVNMQDTGHQDFNSEDAKDGKKLPGTGCKNKSTIRIVKTRPRKPHVRTRVYSDADSHTCAASKKSFKTRNSLIRHVRSCSSLTQHKRIHTGDRPYKCTVCDKAFTRSSSLSLHKRVHSGDRPYKCAVCKKAFTFPSNLAAHKRIHSSDRSYKCTVCSKTFKHSFNLARHTRTHCGDRPFKCTVCNKAFTESSSLAKHKRIHSGHKLYNCTISNKAFAQSSTLAVHKHLHSGDRPYKCTIYNKAFIQACRLAVHKRVHSSDRPY